MHRRTFLACAALLPFAPGCASAQDPGLQTLPISFDAQGRPVLQVTINGRTYPFALDTAAQATGIGADFIRSAGLTPNGNRAMLHGSGGATAVDLYTIARLDIGALHKTDVTALPLQHAETQARHDHSGVLGINLFAGTRLDFDYPNRRLRIDSRTTREPLPESVSVDLRHNVFALTPIQIGGVAATAVLDTGAGHSMGNLALRNALGFGENDPRLSPAASDGGATGHVVAVMNGEVTDVRLAAARLDRLTVSFAAAPVFNALQLGDQPAIIVGEDVFHRLRRFSIDYTSRQFAAES